VPTDVLRKEPKAESSDRIHNIRQVKNENIEIQINFKDVN
jgi:hypothetical protein